MGPKSIENNVLKIFGRDLSEIGAPWTPGVSIGTKFLVSKIFSYHPQMMSNDETKNLVPRDTPGVHGAPISERSQPKIFKTLLTHLTSPN